MKIPRIVIAAPKSGSGKTLITCALMSNLKARGLKVSAFKCGPDYIDPMFHKTVLKIPSRNLDTFFSKEKLTREIFLMGEMKSSSNETIQQIAVIEGVMGLYDGLGGIMEEASTYHVAEVLNAPIVMVVDAHGMGRSVIALIRGFLDMDRKGLIKGVILNRVSRMFYMTIKPIIEEELSIKVFGYFEKNEGVSFESRYLGLKLPSEIEEIEKVVQNAGDILGQTVDVDGLLLTARQIESREFDVDIKKLTDSEIYSQKMVISEKKKPRIAVARDEAFCFIYEDNLRILRERGAELVFFSPLNDSKLPEGVDGLILYGGYPELYTEKLSANESMRSSIKKAVAGGMPVVAECGGFMYLHKAIVTQDEKKHEMVGVIDGEAFYKGKLVRFGYVNIVDKTEQFIHKDEKACSEAFNQWDFGQNDNNVSIPGHEFHYFDSTCNGSDCIMTKPVSNRSWEGIVVTENMWAGFPHLYYPAAVGFVDSIIGKCIKYKITNEKR